MPGQCEKSIFDVHCKPEFDKISTKTEKILKILNGNGEMGLVAKVKVLEQSEQEKKKDRKWATRAVIGASIVAIVRFGFDFLQDAIATMTR